MSTERKGITYYGPAAQFIEETPAEELLFYELVNNLTNSLYEAMERQGMTKADLARAMGKTRAAVTQNLAGETNFTIKTLAHYLTVLNHELVFKVVKNSENGAWSWKNLSQRKFRRLAPTAQAHSKWPHLLEHHTSTPPRPETVEKCYGRAS